MPVLQELPTAQWDVQEIERDDVYLPTQDEILEACREIQANWTESERARRARGQAGRQRTTTVSPSRFVRLLIDSKDFDDCAA